MGRSPMRSVQGGFCVYAFGTPAMTIAQIGMALTLLVGSSSLAPALPVVDRSDVFDTNRVLPSLTDPIALAMRQHLESGSDHHLVLSSPERTAIKSFYEARGWQPIWFQGGLVSDAGRSAIRRLRQSAEDGLDPANYPTPSYDLGLMWPVTAEQVARSELRLASSILLYSRHAQVGRLDPARVSPSIALQPELSDPLDTLVAVARSSDPGQKLGSYNPKHPDFLALRKHLTILRGMAARHGKTPPAVTVFVSPGPTMRPGERDRRVPMLRQRLSAEPVISDPHLFDADLRAAVIEFQSNKGLQPDGLVGRQTLDALNQKASDASTASILANMEMWRWMPRDLGPVHVIVNVPEYRLRIVRGSETVHSTPVIVGKLKHQTPIFSDEMEHIVVNPYWNVPLSIKRNEMLSSIRANPAGYLQSRGYEVLYGGRAVHPASIPWNANTIQRVNIRQRPGSGNALGQVKFLFPNKHAVYLHDTPSRHLFQKSERAFSHGCIRVKHPFDFADALLKVDKKVSGSQIRRLIGKKERWVNLSRLIPVHISYFTTWVDETGTLRTARDIYGHEEKIRILLRL